MPLAVMFAGMVFLFLFLFLVVKRINTAWMKLYDLLCACYSLVYVELAYTIFISWDCRSFDDGFETKTVLTADLTRDLIFML